MSSSTTPRLELPYIISAQSQKEATHGEGLNVLDALVQTVAEDRDLSAPPSSPADGRVWIVAGGATGAWSGHDGELAQFVGGGWRFLIPFSGLRAWLADEGVEVRFDGTQWVAGVATAARLEVQGQQVVGPRQPAIADPAGGSTIDTEARAAIGAVLAALRSHGLIES